MPPVTRRQSMKLASKPATEDSSSEEPKQHNNSEGISDAQLANAPTKAGSKPKPKPKAEHKGRVVASRYMNSIKPARPKISNPGTRPSTAAGDHSSRSGIKRRVTVHTHQSQGSAIADVHPTKRQALGAVSRPVSRLSSPKGPTGTRHPRARASNTDSTDQRSMGLSNNTSATRYADNPEIPPSTSSDKVSGLPARPSHYSSKNHLAKQKQRATKLDASNTHTADPRAEASTSTSLGMRPELYITHLQWALIEARSQMLFNETKAAAKAELSDLLAQAREEKQRLMDEKRKIQALRDLNALNKWLSENRKHLSDINSAVEKIKSPYTQFGASLVQTTHAMPIANVHFDDCRTLVGDLERFVETIKIAFPRGTDEKVQGLFVLASRLLELYRGQAVENELISECTRLRQRVSAAASMAVSKKMSGLNIDT